MLKIPVRTASANYTVMLAKSALFELNKHLKALFPRKNQRYFVVTSPEIWALWSPAVLASFAGTPPAVLFVPPGEKYKRLAQVEHLATQLSQAGADRQAVLLALGGGVIGDMAGFLAAIYMRGIEYVQIPTTLLAQVDSSVGGKTGVNLTSGKNLVGAFHHPKAVLIDVETLATLAPGQLRAGLFESIKAGLIRDRSLFARMERDQELILGGDTAMLERVITASVRMKAKVVAEDEREAGPRMILNFGHTIGHALEAVAGFGKLLHGDAVGWGMLAALQISRQRGLPEPQYARAASVIRSYGLPVLPRLSADKLLAATARDKKNAGGLRRFVLLKAIGQAYVSDDITNQEVLAAIRSILEPVRR